MSLHNYTGVPHLPQNFVLGLKGCPHVRHAFVGEELIGDPHMPQNFAPGFKELLHLGQFMETVTEGVPQKAQNLAPGTRGLLHFGHVLDCLG